MKLLHVISSMDPSLGGLSQAIRNLVPPLKKLGVQSEVVSLDEPNAAFLNSDSFTVHALGPMKGPWSYSAKLTPWLVENCSRFDVIIIHGLWLYHSYSAIKVLSRLRSATKSNVPKLFVMPHGMLDPYFQRAPDRKIKALRNWLYWKIIESKVVNRADGLLFTCESELLLAREPFSSYFPKREMNVGLGIQDPPGFVPAMREAFIQRCPDLNNRRYILFLGRIHEKKGVDLLINAFLEFERKSKDQYNSGLVLVVAGPGLDTAYGQRVQHLVSKAGELKNSIIFPGMLAGNAKWGAFYGCEAFILPSHQENFGISVAEALATSKPALISNQVNICKEIERAGGGFVADDTLEGTKSLLSQWGNLSDDQRVEMGKRAHNAFKKHFAIEPVAKRLSEAIAL
ncbi:MAG TPA: glycosyltransferase [Chryseolinea sp.]|nr:glycosyltransferase [Chryseolinea sp.]